MCCGAARANGRRWGEKVASRKSVLKARRWRGSGEAACLAREWETALLKVRVSIEVQSGIVRLINMGLPGTRRGGRKLGAMACAGCCRAHEHRSGKY
jgi:hypothetical protein